MEFINDPDEEKWLIEIKDAYEFYSQSPDGQYDLFVAHELAQTYFAYTGISLEEKNET